MGISIDEMVKDQDYQPISAEDFFKKASEIEWEESLEDLLQMID